jgi:signal transduction histidine kinase/AraC-like DNA-binding protein/ABC-type sugar transport system substrate-binding protein
MRNLKRNRPTIGVLAGWPTFPGTIHSFLDIVYKGILSAAIEFDCNLLFGCGVGSPFNDSILSAMPVVSPHHVAFTPVGPWNTDGLIILGPLFNENLESYFQGLIDSGFPVVFGGDRETGPAVVVDNEDGITQAINHLIEHGHKQIAMITGFEVKHGDSAARLRGFRSAMARHELTCDPDLIVPGLHNVETSYLAMKRILETGKSFSAVITSNDETAVGAVKAINEAGLSVPEDIAVIGFDDRLEARANIPLLTTVHFPMFQMGYHSLELLVQIIQGISRLDSFIRIPTHLVIRESCGCLPGEIPSGNKFRQYKSEITNPYHSFSSHYHDRSGIVSLPAISRSMATTVDRELSRIGKSEVDLLCNRLLDAYIKSLENGDAAAFRQAVQQILNHVVSQGDDLYSWQGAISVLREWTPNLLKILPHSLFENQAENLLHQARIAINEMLRGQYSRDAVEESAVSTQINRLTSRFFAVNSEEELFQVLENDIPSLGIEQAAVVTYKAQGEDPYALSEIRIPTLPRGPRSFPSRDFPPPQLFDEEKPFHLFMIPIFGPEGVVGHASFQGDNISFLGTVVRQMAAALRSVYLFQAAVEGRQMAEEANYLKGRFLSIVSHELRTPLNLIIGLSNMMLLENETVNDQKCLVGRKDLERIYIGAQHLESLIRDVLDLAQNDLGQLKLVFESFDLHEILAPINEIGQQLARDKDLVWEANILPGPLTVLGDRARLRQVILNLLNNAVKFTMHGKIIFAVQMEDNQYVISVSDTGLGIPLEEQKKIFDEFQQSTRTSSRGFGGLGLGLAICRNLIELHGGKVGVHSKGEEGSGSTFFFTIPISKVDAIFLETNNTEEQSEYLLLLVKDSVEGDRLKNHLVRQGYQVGIYVLKNNEDWLSLITKMMPDKIVLDLGFTSERGWDILKSIKENPTTSAIPILFYNIDSNKDTGSFLDLNIMRKPLGMNDLADALLVQNKVNMRGGPDQNSSILIVDDEEEILDLHARMLETLTCGFQILKARNGLEALELIRQFHPILTLLDLMMPTMDGFTLLETLQAEELNIDHPIIVLSSQTLTKEDVDRLNDSVVSVLNKGIFTADETISHIDAALSRRRKPGSEARRVIMKAMAYIHQNYSEAITRSDIANYVNLSERHLTRCFNQEVGLTPMTYLNRYRVHQAKLLLEAGKKGITEIALQVGFSNSSYFTRVFRDEVGMSPREYLTKP